MPLPVFKVGAALMGSFSLILEKILQLDQNSMVQIPMGETL